MSYWTYHWAHDGQSYGSYLRQKELAKDISRGTKAVGERISAALSDQTRDIVGSLKQVERTMERGFGELNATFTWGFTETIAQMGRMNDSLEELIRVAKTPAQTAAFEQFEIARDMFRQGLMPEAMDALDKAVNGVPGISPGHALEWRFHHLRGTILLGSFERHDEDVVNVAEAEQAFLRAARYARKDYPGDAARAMLGAGWAAYVSASAESPGLKRALQHSEAAVALAPAFGEAIFQTAKCHMAMDNVGAASSLLATPEIGAMLLVKAAADGDFKKHDGAVRGWIARVREAYLRDAVSQIEAAFEALQSEMDSFERLRRAPIASKLHRKVQVLSTAPLLELEAYAKVGVNRDCVALNERAAKVKLQHIEELGNAVIHAERNLRRARAPGLVALRKQWKTRRAWLRLPFSLVVGLALILPFLPFGNDGDRPFFLLMGLLFVACAYQADKIGQGPAALDRLADKQIGTESQFIEAFAAGEAGKRTHAELLAAKTRLADAKKTWGA